LPDRPLRILHAHSTFSLGGKEARAVRLMNAMSDEAQHVIWSAMPDRLSARDAIDPSVKVDFPADAPPLAGSPTPARLRRLAAFMKPFDLILTYNWGAFDAVMAKRMFGGPSLIHHEDGFNEDEAVRLKPARNLYRRLGLPAAHRLVVPSRRLEEIALTRWGQRPDRLTRISNGVPVDRFERSPEPGSIPGLERRPGEIVVGTAAGLRRVKNLPLLVRAFSQALPAQTQVRLVIVGEGPEAAAIEREASAWGVEQSLLMPGFLTDPARWIGHFDVFALSSDTEQQPISLMEAMAAGCAVVATKVGDVPSMLPGPAAPFLVEPGDESGFARALRTLLGDRELRRQLGEANLNRACEQFDEADMIVKYVSLYREAIRASVRS
jgi:glycosyltransferase involved in cell wall biosynthesis